MDVQAADQVVTPWRRDPAAEIALGPVDALATSDPTAWAVDLPKSRAVTEKSSAVTRHPEEASQIASDPCPQPASRARPGGKPATSFSRWVFGGRLDTISGLSRRTRAQRSSQELRSNLSFVMAQA